MNHESLAQFLPSSVGASDSAHVSNAGQQRAQDKFQIALRILSCSQKQYKHLVFKQVSW